SKAASSMVTRHAVERRLPSLRLVLFAMAVDAPAHRERRGRGTQPDQVLEIVDERRSRPRTDDPHLLDGAVAALTGEPGLHVGLVREVGELGNLEDPDP